MKNPLVEKLLKNGATWSNMWLNFGQQIYPYDDNFKAISNYAKNNDISDNKVKKLK